LALIRPIPSNVYEAPGGRKRSPAASSGVIAGWGAPVPASAADLKFLQLLQQIQ